MIDSSVVLQVLEPPNKGLKKHSVIEVLPGIDTLPGGQS